LIPDDKTWLALVTGALSELTHEYNFEEFGTATPDETAQRFRDMLSALENCETYFVNDLVVVEERQSNSVNGGTFTAFAWRTRALNTLVIDTGGIASLSANQLTLPAGTYRARALGLAYQTGTNQLSLYNVTASAFLMFGTAGYSAPSTDGNNESFIEGQFTLSATSDIELRHICGTTVATTGFGKATSVNWETYARLVIERLAE